MAAAYSSCGRTRVVKAASLTPDIFILMFLCTKPRVLWAVPVILSMCERQDKLLEMSTQRYLAQVTVSRATPCSTYVALTSFLEPATCTIWHLEGLNSMSQSDSHTESRSKSCFYRTVGPLFWLYNYSPALKKWGLYWICPVLP